MIQKTFIPFVPFENCGWKDSWDGTCSHPKNATPECHQFCCPIKAVTPPNKACSRRVPRRGAKVVKSKSKVMVGRTRG